MPLLTDFTTYFANTYDSGSYGGSTYENSTTGSSTSGGTTASSGTKQVLTDTGFDLLLAATIAVTLIFIALIVRFWKRPAPKKESSL